jgi:alkylhydroperoxidase/carboxymuconolactone decarboxylase family protein YurZ
VGLGWFAPGELEAIPMRTGVREAVLTAFGLREPVDTTAAMLTSLTSAFGGDFKAPGLASGAPAAEGSAAGEREAFLRTVDAYRRGDMAPGMELDGRTAALESVAILAATGRCEDLGAFAERALDHGASPRDLVETLRLVARLAGMPAASAGWAAVADVLCSRGIAVPGDAP